MQEKLYKLMNWPLIEGIIYSEEDNPHQILGPHRIGTSLVFQAFWPEAVSGLSSAPKANGSAFM